jgi:multidrug efflux pump subunit AcrA (membrane-fusion protein)
MHTASVEATPASEPSPHQLAPQREPIPENNDPANGARSRRWWWIALAAAAVIVIGIWAGTRNKNPASTRTARAIPENPEQILRLKGTTEAVQSRAILAPRLASEHVSTLTVIHLLAGGTRVKQGDVLAEFDRQAQMKEFIDKQAEYEKLLDQVAQEQAKESAAQAKDQTELKTAEDNLRKTELENQKAEIVSRIDAEKKREDFEEAKATYDQLRETFDLKRKAAQAAIRILEIQRDRTQQTMTHARANAELMQVRSPLDGVVVLNTIWKQGTMGEVQEGDQVRPGVPFMQVVNPSIMQVRVLANQEDFPFLQVGQSAKVRLDAYPEMVFPAKLDQVAPIGQGGDFSSKLHSFMVIVSIQGNDPKLMPDLSAAVDVDLAKRSAESAAPTTRSGT